MVILIFLLRHSYRVFCPRDKVLLHNRETYWIAFFNTAYNIRRIGGSGIGHVHTEEFKIKKSLATMGEKNPMFGVRFFGPLNPFFGHKHTEETKQILSKANSGVNHPFYGKSHTEEAKLKQSMARGTTIFLYSLEFELLETFVSARKAGLYLGISKGTVLKEIL